MYIMDVRFVFVFLLLALMGCASKKPCMPQSYGGWLQMQEDLRLKGKEYNPDDYRQCDIPGYRYPKSPEENDWSIISVPAADPYRNQIKD